jgi:hypothetical protein
MELGERIAAAVHAYESAPQDLSSADHPESEDQPLRWMVLTAALPAATQTLVSAGLYITVPSVPSSANANPACWQANGNSGAGGYCIDTTLNYAVAETTGKRSYASGDWVLCRPMGSQNGWFWEPVGPVDKLFPFEAHDDITPGGSGFKVWLLINSGGSLVRDTSAGNSPTGSTPTKVDDAILGDSRAWGSHHSYGSGSSTGARGWYQTAADGANHIVSIDNLARLIIGSGPSSAVAGGATYTLSGVTCLDDGQTPAPGSNTVQVTNYSTGLPANATSVVCVADGSGGFRTLDGPCP